MSTLNGQRTEVVKLQLESNLSFNRTLIKEVGKFVFDSPGSGTYSADADYTAPVSGDNLIVRANQPIKSTSAIAVTITGQDEVGGALTGTATIGALVPEGQSYEVVPNVVGKKFKTITSITATNGIKGDGFDVAVLPDADDDVEIVFDQGLNAQLGKEVKPIYKKYDLDHNKRIRGDHTLTIGQFYMNNLDSLPLIHNRDVVIRQDFKDDGGNAITEVRYYNKCRLSVTVESPAAEDGEVTCNAEGTFGKAYIFS